MTDRSDESKQARSTLAEVVQAAQSLAETMVEHGLSRIHVSVDEIAIELDGPKVPKTIRHAAHPTSDSEKGIPVFEEQAQDQANFYILKAPMVGTFYHAAGPEEEPFIKVGEHVAKDQRIGIIEAMKIMNEITTDRAGEVVEIVAANSLAVEYGSPLIKIRPDEPVDE